MAATRVQTKRGTVAGSSANPVTVSATFDSTPTAGNMILASVRGYAGGTAVTVTWSDNKGNSWAEDIEAHDSAVGGSIISMGSAYAATATATFTVTASITNTGTVEMYLVLEISEWSGLENAHADKTSSSNGASSTTVNTATTATLTQANELVLAVADSRYNSGANSVTYEQAGTVPSSGWTNTSIAADSDNTGLNGAYAYVSVSATTGVRHVWTMANAANNVGAIATYKIADTGLLWAQSLL
jgi:hypothetical protein